MDKAAQAFITDSGYYDSLAHIPAWTELMLIYPNRVEVFLPIRLPL